MPNVDTSAPKAERVKVMWKLVDEVVQRMHPADPDEKKLNLKKFLLHVPWHEGAFLQYRRQQPSGPGRSFFQFEPPLAKDAVMYAKQQEAAKKWLSLLAEASGQTKEALEAAGNQLPNSGGWPADNLVEKMLLDKDLFGIYLARIALAKIPAAIGTSHEAHAQYWADHWKKVFDSAAQKKELMERFAKESQEADGLLPTVSLSVGLESEPGKR
jgi:hypothetical protein